MSEYTAPALINNLTTTRLLTNTSGTSIMLQVQKQAADVSVFPALVQLAPDESVFYNSIVDINDSNVTYNEDIISNYISNGIISDQSVYPEPPIGYLQSVPNATHTLSIVNDQLSKQISSNKIDTLEVFYSITATENLQILVYRGLSGFFYSFDSGQTIIPIPTTGMQYPNEVTSIAIQNAASVSMLGFITIWAGTLREGLLSYTIGDAGWSNQVDSERDLLGNFLFRNFNTVNSIKIPSNYSQIYILGILNTPISAGIPIVLYVKSFNENSTVPTVKILYKYLSSNYVSFIKDTTYNIYRQALKYTQSSDTGYTWTPVLGFNLDANVYLFDVLKSIPFGSSVLTVAATSNLISSPSTYKVSLLSLSISNEVSDAVIPVRTLTINEPTAFKSTVNILSNKFSGISTHGTDIFITEKTKVWRYTKNAWTTWIQADGTDPERNTQIDSTYTFTLTDSVSYLSGFRGFGVLESVSEKRPLGLLNTDFGYVIFKLSKTSVDPILPLQNSKILRPDLFGTSAKDLQIIPEANIAVSCGLLSEPLTRYLISNMTFTDPLRYVLYSPMIFSQLPSSIQYSYTQIFYKNYIFGTILPYFVNKFNASEIPSSDQIYTELETSASVFVLKDISDLISYLDTTNTFNWLKQGSSSIQDQDYFSKTLKYLRLKLLLQTRQEILSTGAILSSNLEIPFFPDINL